MIRGGGPYEQRAGLKGRDGMGAATNRCSGYQGGETARSTISSELKVGDQNRTNMQRESRRGREGKV